MPCFEWLYTDVDKVIKESKPIRDINIPELPDIEPTVSIPDPVVEIPFENITPAEPIIPEPTTSEPVIEPTHDTTPIEKPVDQPITVPKGKNVTVAVSDNAGIKDR